MVKATGITIVNYDHNALTVQATGGRNRHLWPEAVFLVVCGPSMNEL
jgi:hypothetical protein